jgi:hypothetical protein
MADCPAHWALCGGWAVDAWLGRVSRDHGDVDVSIFHDDQRALFEHLVSGWELVAHDHNVPDATTDPWTGRWLDLPAHVHARPVGAGQPLGEELDPGADGFRLDIQLGERVGEEWVLTREPYVAVPLAGSIVDSAWGVPVVAPAVLLAFKALELRPRDEQDFAALLPHLTGDERAALARAVAQIDAAHPWLKELSPS